MKRLRIFLGAVILTATAVFTVQAEECELELVRLDSKSTGNDWIYRNVSQQHFFAQFGKNMSQQQFEIDFKKLVKKEPEKYLSEHPFRGVAKLGSKQYCFAFDKKEEKSKGYDRLYFDLNDNGDLTDDTPIDTEQTSSPNVGSNMQYVNTQFPRVDMTIDVDGKNLDYSFFMQVTWQKQGNDFEYASGSLRAGTYRKGEITIDGKAVKIALLDFNCNGRFDDISSMSDNIRGMNDELYPQYGDMLLIDPENAMKNPQSMSSRSANEFRQYLSKLNSFNDKFYNIKVSPLGDELTWTLSTTPLGKVTSEHAPCTVELFGNDGYISLKLEKDKPASVPVGEWHLLSYDIQIQDWKEGDQKDKEEKSNISESKTPSLFDTIKKALVGAATQSSNMYGPANLSQVAARGTRKGQNINVKADETFALKFGPPYKLGIQINSNPGLAYIRLVIRGAGGETVNNMIINGKRPPKPEFTITDSKGEVVQQGSFEYG